MRITTAQRVAPEIPPVIGAIVGSIIERTVAEQNPHLNQFQCLRQARDIFASLDLQTCVDIICCEARS